MPALPEAATNRVVRMEQATADGEDGRSRDSLYKQAMMEAAVYESRAEMALAQDSSLDVVYAAMATMKYAKANALKVC